MGFVKGRFPSLKGLRQQIKNKTDHLRAVEWVRACLVIHTLIFDIESDMERDSNWEEALIQEGLSSDSSDSSDSDGVPREIQRENAGQRKRRKVKEALYASGVTSYE